MAIEFDLNELAVVMNCFDVTVRQGGLEAAQHILPIATVVQQQINILNADALADQVDQRRAAEAADQVEEPVKRKKSK